MSDDRHYVPGDFYRMCERTGFKIRARATSREWTGRIVRRESWEPRQPQDFVRGIVDDQTVPDPRPRQTDVFLGPVQTTVARNALAGDGILVVASYAGINIGDMISVILDSKDTFVVRVLALPAFSSGFSSGFLSGLQLAIPLPYSVSVGNFVTDNSNVSRPNIG